MQLTREVKAKCEINRCGKKADYTINLNRAGIRSKIHICSQCLGRLYAVVGDALIPKSIETLKRKTNE